MDPRDKKPKYDLYKVDYDWVKKTSDKRELKKAYEALVEDGAFPDLEKTVKEKLMEVDPHFKRLHANKNSKISKEQKEAIDNDIDKFIEGQHNDDEALKGNRK